MYVLVGAVSGKEYTRYREKEYLYRLLIKERPTKSRNRKGEINSKSKGAAMLENAMPEPMIIRRIK
ncbi:hypothetical protein NE293_03920 [Latilactobacillus curvatus]|uniref:hypothetical protein n=1 Tax=Latilactobacillus curvatus TaxID=28038 RepID=UPI002073F0CC|nr:hypothetical protein [Latilactobacillus curvatus]MCM6843826.1 hypothetical protein [Latilactobacillus curvatus]MCM6861287.1 hypothetical protein [Latilactobacillus curvatus]MCM6868585.1 hypothetical protein [Latilactobacillus curvatus]